MMPKTESRKDQVHVCSCPLPVKSYGQCFILPAAMCELTYHACFDRKF